MGIVYPLSERLGGPNKLHGPGALNPNARSVRSFEGQCPCRSARLTAGKREQEIAGREDRADGRIDHAETDSHRPAGVYPSQRIVWDLALFALSKANAA